MTRKISILLGVLIVSFLCTAQAQTEEKKGMKTVTLPNGDVIMDISGEWDAFIQYYGIWGQGGEWEQRISITQNGSSFEGLRSMDSDRMKKGSVLIKGDLHKGGLKNVLIGTSWGLLQTGTQITEGGDKIEIDSWDKVRVYRGGGAGRDREAAPWHGRRGQDPGRAAQAHLDLDAQARALGAHAGLVLVAVAGRAVSRGRP